MNSPDDQSCRCHHDPQFFAQCAGKVAPDETLCAWCKSGHPPGFGLLAETGRNIAQAFRLWTRRTF